MKNHRWTIHEGTRCIDTGTVIAESERDAMREVMSRGSELPIEMDKCYRITVGDTTMSSYGDEFIRSAEVTGWGEDAEQENLQGGHIFNTPLPPVLTDEMIKKIARSIGAKVLTDALKKLIKATAAAGKSMEDLGAAMDGDWDPDEYEYAKGMVMPNHGGFPFIPGQCDADRQREFNENLGACGPLQPCPDDGQDHDLNDNAVNPITGEIHGCCKKCGWIEPKGTGKMANDPYGAPPMGLPRGTDRIVGRALHGAKKGEVVKVILNPQYGGGTYTSETGGDVAVNEGVRIGAGGHVYPPPRVKINNHLPYVGEISNGVGKPISNIPRGTIYGKKCEFDFSDSEPDVVTTFPCECGSHIPVTHLPAGQTSGVPCPDCKRTYTIQKDY